MPETESFNKDKLTLKALVAALKGKTVAELHKFAQKQFGERLGQGAYRKVWKVQLRNRTVVLKVANGEDKHIRESNAKELRVYSKCKHLSIIARMYAHDTSGQNRWIVSQFIPHLADNDKCMAFFNISRKEWRDQIYSFSGDSMNHYFSDKKELQDNPWYKEMKELLEKGKVFDLHGANWRLNDENKPILVDYGCADI